MDGGGARVAFGVSRNAVIKKGTAAIKPRRSMELMGPKMPKNIPCHLQRKPKEIPVARNLCVMPGGHDPDHPVVVVGVRKIITFCSPLDDRQKPVAGNRRDQQGTGVPGIHGSVTQPKVRVVSARRNRKAAAGQQTSAAGKDIPGKVAHRGNNPPIKHR